MCVQGFNTQPPEGGWLLCPNNPNTFILFQHTAARRRLAATAAPSEAIKGFQHTAARRRLAHRLRANLKAVCFNTQPPEGGWHCRATSDAQQCVSTHSRPKAAGLDTLKIKGESAMFQHTAARRRLEAFG